MGQRHRNCVAELEARPNAIVQALDPEDAARSQATHGNDNRGPQEPELPVEPEAAEIELLRRRRPGAAAPGGAQ
jgi:hypothetical protein